jgi:protein TonB
MSNISIFEKKWIDLVFEGKNQKYGAYKLRQESSKTTLFAFLFGITFLVGGTLLLSSFSKVPEKIAETPPEFIIKVDGYHPTSNDSKPKTERPKADIPATKTPENNKNYHVARTEEAVIPVTTTTENPIPNGPTNSNGTETGLFTNIPSSGDGSSIPKIPENNNPVGTKELDRQPNFPGGLKGFYEYVGNNFEKQEIEEGETVKVLISFVIERNGSMTNIDVVEKTTPDVDKEAIRVLKSLKTRWEPGYKDGETVRTRYTLPITVKSE